MSNKKYHLKMKSYFSNNKICFIFFLLLIFISFTIQNFMFIAEADKSEFDLGPLNINYTLSNCTTVIPHLIYPILCVYKGYPTDQKKKLGDLEVETPLFLKQKIFGNLFQLKNSDLYLSIQKNDNFGDNCYFGLSILLPNNTNNTVTEVNNFKILKDKKEINETIFSFNKWEILNNSIKSELHYGYSHPDFSSKDGIIGTCINTEENSFWSCIFNNITFQNKTISLKKDDNEYYKIYFSSESHDIYFPNDFKDIFINASEGNCTIEEIETMGEPKTTYKCINYFEEDNNISIALNNENMSIFLDVDNYQRFSKIKSEKRKNHSRILFKNDIKDPIFPLIMFKQFHIQFNGEKNIINFFTKDKNILKVKTEPKNDSSDSDSSGVTVFLVILLIILFLAICFGIFYFVKKKLKTSVENDINKFNKFEDEEENGKVMNDKKVY